MHKKNTDNNALRNKYSMESSSELIGDLSSTEKTKNLDEKDLRDGSFSSHMVRKMFDEVHKDDE